MAWFRIIDKATRERQHVQCRPSDVRTLYPADRYFLPRRLPRAPGEADVFDQAAGKLRKCRATAQRIADDAALARMTRAELVEMIVARLRP